MLWISPQFFYTSQVHMFVLQTLNAEPQFRSNFHIQTCEQTCDRKWARTSGSWRRGARRCRSWSRGRRTWPTRRRRSARRRAIWRPTTGESEFSEGHNVEIFQVLNLSFFLFFTKSFMNTTGQALRTYKSFKLNFLHSFVNLLWVNILCNS